MTEKTLISKILIVGGGVTGSVTASLIKHEAFVSIEIWEKMDQIGSHFQAYHTSNELKSLVDCGIQYVNISLEFIRSQARFYDELLEKGLVIPLGDKIENFRKLSETKIAFAVPEGRHSLINHFLDKADCEVHLNHKVVEINLQEDKKLWEVRSSNGEVKEFDVVILTIPAPEVLKLSGNFLSLNQDDDVKVAMEQVKYAPCFAIALFYNEPVAYFLEELPTPRKFFPEDDILHFICVYNKRDERKSKDPDVAILSTTAFAKDCADKSEDEIKTLMMEQIKNRLPQFPEPADIKLFHWAYSKLVDPYIDSPGCIVLNSHPCLISGGDSYSKTSFYGSITSSLKIVEELLKHVNFIKGRRRSSST